MHHAGVDDNRRQSVGRISRKMMRQSGMPITRQACTELAVAQGEEFRAGAAAPALSRTRCRSPPPAW